MTDSNDMDNSTSEILKNDFNTMIANVYAFVKANGGRSPKICYIVTNGVKTGKYITLAKYNEMHTRWVQFIQSNNGALPNFIYINKSPTPTPSTVFKVPSYSLESQPNAYTCGPTSLSMALTELFGDNTNREAELAKWAGTTTSGTSHSGLKTAFIDECNKKGVKGIYSEASLSTLTQAELGALLVNPKVAVICHGNTKGWPSHWKNEYGHYVYPIAVNTTNGVYTIADPTKGVITYSKTEFEAGLKLISNQNSFLIFTII